MTVIKKDGTQEAFNPEKIIIAIHKSAERVMIKLTSEDENFVVTKVLEFLGDRPEVSVPELHNQVEAALDQLNPAIAKSYRDYRNYKKDFVHMMDEVYQKSQSIRYIGDKSNANTDSALVSTQRSLIYSELNSELYKKFFLNKEELQAMKDGYIYIHDRSARLDTMNCFRRDTKFITSKGVKSFYDFKDGDTVEVKTHLGNWKKAIVHSYGYQPIQKVVLKQGTGTSKPREIYCTPNHRWILKSGEETTSLKVGDYLWQVPDQTKIDWETMSLEEKKLWCAGFAMGDGALNGEQGGQLKMKYVTVRLCGKKSQYYNRFIDCGYSVKYPDSTAPDPVVHMLQVSSKDIPIYDLNHLNIKYYIDGLLCADGHKNLKETASSKYRGIQVTGYLNKYIYDMLCMAGYHVTSINNYSNKTTNYGKYSDSTYLYRISSSQQNASCWRVIDIEPIELNHNSQVWCLEVEDDHSFLLDGGIPTGNCCLANMTEILTNGFEMGNGAECF